MTRLTLGAITLIDAVSKKWEDVHVEHGEPDGIGVRRAIKFDEVTSKELTPILKALGDKRIANLHEDETGLVVVFVETYRADTREPFDLDSAQVVANADGGRPGRGVISEVVDGGGVKPADETDGQFKPEEVEDEVKPAKKAAAKKNVPKKN